MIEFQQDHFERSAERFPASIAVDDHGKTMTYRELEARANRIAHFLIEKGSGPNERVCIFTEKNIDMYSAVLGTLKSGGCWVPLSTAFPPERMSSILLSLRPKAVVVSPSTLDLAREARRNSGLEFSILVLGTDVGDSAQQIFAETDLIGRPATRPPREDLNPEDLAYIIFTSGSTGTPKGVMVLHRNTTQFLALCGPFFNIGPGTRFAHFSELTFDPSVFDLFHCWSTGGTLVPFNKRSYRINPGAFIAEQKVQVLFTVPSVLASIRDAGMMKELDLSCLQHLLLTGEALSGTVLEAWQNVYPDTQFYNLFGTTETAIISHWYRFPRNFKKDLPIPVGHPIPGTRVLILDGDRPAAKGEVGESVVYGSQLSPGYWANEFQTQSVFVHHPLEKELPQKVYRTGDLLREGDGGLHFFAGRADKQVKVRGHRVELGEIETIINRYAQVRESVVMAVSLGEGGYDKRLVAFIIAGETVSVADLTSHLAVELPGYMVPSRVVQMIRDFPRNANGKIDLVALKHLAAEALKGGSHEVSRQS